MNGIIKFPEVRNHWILHHIAESTRAQILPTLLEKYRKEHSFEFEYENVRKFLRELIAKKFNKKYKDDILFKAEPLDDFNNTYDYVVDLYFTEMIYNYLVHCYINNKKPDVS